MSDSGTPRKPDGASVTAAGRSLWDQVAHAAEPLDPFWITRIRAAILAIEAGLDVDVLRIIERTIYNDFVSPYWAREPANAAGNAKRLTEKIAAALAASEDPAWGKQRAQP